MSTAETITLSGLNSNLTISDRADLVVPRQLGSVRLVRELGRGGMGTVWLAQDALLGRDVAVKFLLYAVTDADDPEFARFLTGARAAAALRHPALTTLYAAELIEGVPYLVMEYINGPTVAAALEKCGAMDPAAAYAIMDAAASAIGELHDRNIVHRDIKPANVLLDTDGRAFVTDFGLALRRTTGGKGTEIAGTPQYMSPEMFDGAVSPKSDVYALGVMLFEMLCGTRPFEGTNSAAIAREQRGPLPTDRLRERGIPQTVIDVIERAVHVNPMFRHKSGEAFRHALREACGGSKVDAQRGSRAVAALVLRTLEKPASPDGADPATTIAPPSRPSHSAASYFDELSSIATRKREGSGPKQRDGSKVSLGPPVDASSISKVNIAGGLVSPSAAPSETPAPSVDHLPRTAISSGIAAEGVTCIKCEYDLRGIEVDAMCPECGANVQDSMVTDRLIFASPQWLGRIKLGLMLLRSAALAILLLLVSSTLLMEQIISDATFKMIMWPSIALATLGPLVGVWLATTCEPGRNATPSARLRSHLARASLLICLPTTVLLKTTGVMNAVHMVIGITIAIIFGGAIFAGVYGFGQFIAKIIARIPQDKAAKKIQRDAFGTALLLSFVPVMGRLRAMGHDWPSMVMILGVISGLVFISRLGKVRKLIKKTASGVPR